MLSGSYSDGIKLIIDTGKYLLALMFLIMTLSVQYLKKAELKISVIRIIRFTNKP